MRILIFAAACALAASALPPMPSDAPRTDLPQANLRANEEANILISLKLPRNWRLHPQEKFVYRIDQTSGAVNVDPLRRKGMLTRPRFPIKVPFTPPIGRSEVLLQVAFYYCPRASLADCRAFSRSFLVPVSAGGPKGSRKVPLLVAPDQY